MKDKLRAFYHQDLFEVKDVIEIVETHAQANPCKVTLIGKNLMEINLAFLQTKIFTEGNTFKLGDITDKIVIDATNKVIYLFELKTTIWTGEMKKAQIQLTASYLKLSLYLSLIVDIQIFEIKLFIVGNISNRIKDKDLALKNKDSNIFFLLQKLSKEKIYYLPKFPERAYNTISSYYQKQEVSIQHILPDTIITL